MSSSKVGFLVNDYKCSSHVYRLIQHVAERPHFSDPVVICIRGRPVKKSFTRRLIDRLKKAGWLGSPNAFFVVILSGFIRRLESAIFSNEFTKDHKKLDVRDIPNVVVMDVDGEWSSSGIVLTLTDTVTAEIEKMDFSCLVRCGSGILRGQILEVPRFGVLSFHHGDNRVNRGGPSGFWEVLYKEPSSGFIIQALNNELDGGVVLVRGNIMTANTWISNNARLLEKSNIFFMNLLDKIAINEELPKAENPILHDRQLYKMDKADILLKYLICVILPLSIKKIVNRIFSPKVTRWGVSYSMHNGFSKSLWRYREINNPKGRYLADPFVISREGRDIIFVEDFFYSDKKGRISAIEIYGDSHKFLGVVLEEDFHLSYPFVFESSGELYMIPESHAANEIRLYECIEFPMKWRLKKILMKNVCAADSMVINKNDTWFLFSNICSAKLGDHNSELHIFHSKDLLHGQWEPLKTGNPVIFDSERARNGGFFEFAGELYRVNQVHGKAHYGKAFGINKITNLNLENYCEKRVKTVRPLFKEGLTGAHHFSSNKKFATFDYSRKVRLKDVLSEK
jgi:hypothetical protein